MTHLGQLSPIQRLITTHNSEGKAILSNAFETTVPSDLIGKGDAAFSLLYTTSEFPVDLNRDKDLSAYGEFLIKPPGITQSNGSVMRIVVRDKYPLVKGRTTKILMMNPRICVLDMLAPCIEPFRSIMALS
jgi:hypothetical protein